MEWIVYILTCADGSLYTGITNDLAKRFAAHTAGTGAKYTRGRAPFIISYRQYHDSKSSALKRELEIKALSREQKHKLTTSS